MHASNLEHAGDIIQLNLQDRIRSKIKAGLVFTSEQNNSIRNLCEIVAANIKLAASVTTSRDVAAAQHLISQKDEFRHMEQQVMATHFTATLDNKATALRQSALFIDIIRDIHRVNSHVVAAGYAIVDDAGLLRTSRLRSGKKEKKI